MWIPRQISAKVLTIASQYPALILTGARQVGKTSLLQKLFPEHRLITLDLPSHAELAEKKPGDFFDRFPPPVIIDEVQYAPNLFRHLKIRIDQNRNRYGQYLLTGSQKFTLMKNVSESLAGRCALLELETLSLGEIRRTDPILDLEVMVRGGFPELQSRQDLETQTFYESYLATYLERDVRSLLKIGQLRDFERFLRACAFRSAQIVNKAELARDVGISPPTANEWLSVLHASNQVLLLEPWFSNKTKGLVKSPKLYLADTGLLCHLLGISSVDELKKSPLLGSIWETFVFSEMRKRQVFSDGKWEIYFWRDLRGLEVDFLIHHGGNFDLIEAKFTELADHRDAVGLKRVAEVLGERNVRSMSLVCRTANSYPIETNLNAIPIGEWRSGSLT